MRWPWHWFKKVKGPDPIAVVSELPNSATVTTGGPGELDKPKRYPFTVGELFPMKGFWMRVDHVDDDGIRLVPQEFTKKVAARMAVLNRAQSRTDPKEVNKSC